MLERLSKACTRLAVKRLWAGALSSNKTGAAIATAFEPMVAVLNETTRKAVVR
jgi:hypothetical protein